MNKIIIVFEEEGSGYSARMLDGDSLREVTSTDAYGHESRFDALDALVWNPEVKGALA